MVNILMEMIFPKWNLLRETLTMLLYFEMQMMVVFGASYRVYSIAINTAEGKLEYILSLPSESFAKIIY